MQKKAGKSSKLGWLVLFIIAPAMLCLGVTGASGKEPKALIDLNTASQQDLEGLKGVGSATAKKIIANRPYKSVDELSKAGLSAKKIEALKPFVSVGPSAAKASSVETGTKPAQPSPSPGKAKAASAGSTVPAPAPAKATAAPKAAAGGEKQTKAMKLAPGQKVNINTASKEELEALPGIGPVKAQAIIEGRPYKTPEDIMKVKGIKEGSFNMIKEFITVK